MNMLLNWNEISSGRRVGLIAGVAVILIFLLVSFYWLTQERYAVLFTDLQMGDAASIVEQLERMKVDYKLENGGSRILVPESKVHQSRLKLMGSGAMLSGGVGFEIFDDSDFGMTEFAQKINYQRALQGELTRTIMSLKEVKYARVHLVMPENGLFKREGSTATASVTLFLQNSDKPSSEQILGIQRLVAAAVSGLKSEQVTVTDQNGLTLSRQVASDDGLEAISGRLQQKKSVEQYLADKAMAVLRRAFGSDDVLVSVDATLDFSQVKTTKESVLPPQDSGANGVLKRRESKFGGGSAVRKSDGNVTTEVEYQLGRAVAHIEETPGKILRLSVGVLIPNSVNEEKREQITELVSMALGLDRERGDAIAVYPLEPIVAKIPQGAQQEAAAVSRSTDSLQNAPTGSAAATVWEYIEEHLVAAGITLAVLLMVVFVSITALLARKSSAVPAQSVLSARERDRILLKLREWLESEHNQAPPGEAGI